MARLQLLVAKRTEMLFNITLPFKTEEGISLHMRHKAWGSGLPLASTSTFSVLLLQMATPCEIPCNNPA